MKERFDKMENMLSELIEMVGSMISEKTEIKEQAEMQVELTGIKAYQEEMKREIDIIKAEQEELKNTINILKHENDAIHQKMEETLKMLMNDQDFIWKKAVQNERDIARYVKQQN